MKTKTKAWVNLALFIATLAINALGAFGFINNLSQKEISDKYPTLITPSSGTFSIWGVIYTLLLISLVYMIVKAKDDRTARTIEAVSLPFWVSSIANILWIVTFSYEWIGISTLLILLLVLSLAVLTSRLKAPEGIGQKVNALAFGLYNGWLIVATVVNVAAFLVQVNWDGFGLGADTWALIILVVALLLTALIQLRLRNAVLTLPHTSYFYIYLHHHTIKNHYNGQYPAVIASTLVIAGAFVVIAVIVFILNKRCLLPSGGND